MQLDNTIGTKWIHAYEHHPNLVLKQPCFWASAADGNNSNKEKGEEDNGSIEERR
jgi:hypothetical protein